MQTEDGQITEPYSISAGLDYPGVGPLHAHLHESNRAEFIAITDEEAMQSGLEISKMKELFQPLKLLMLLQFWIKNNSNQLILW